MIKWQQHLLHKSNLTWLQILVYQILVTEQVTDDTEVMTAELKVKMQIADLKLVIELLGLIRDFLMVVTFEEMRRSNFFIITCSG